MMFINKAHALLSVLVALTSATVIPKSTSTIPKDVLDLQSLPNGGYSIFRNSTTGKLDITPLPPVTIDKDLVSNPNVTSDAHSKRDCTGHVLPYWNEMYTASQWAATWCNNGNTIAGNTMEYWVNNLEFFYVCNYWYSSENCFANEIQQTLVTGYDNCGTGQGSWSTFGDRGYGYDPAGVCECGGFCP